MEHDGKTVSGIINPGFALSLALASLGRAAFGGGVPAFRSHG
jgi:hypothetical protein